MLRLALAAATRAGRWPPHPALRHNTFTAPSPAAPTPRGVRGLRTHLTFPSRGGGGPNPDTVLYALLGANGVGYMLWQVAPAFAQQHAVVSAASATARPHTLLTAAFSHRDFGHAAVNMFTLYFFGRGIGHAFGGRALLSLYLAAGVASSAGHVAASTWRCRSAPPPYRAACVARAPGALGASGAVNGIVALSCLTFPRSIVHVWGVLPVPAAALGAMYVLQDVWGAVAQSGGRGRGGGVAHAGHLGGAAVGGAAWLARRRGWWRPRW